ncbi:hypothetical protein Droror1_Dr00004788 [Drosera rotundifolia]
MVVESSSAAAGASSAFEEVERTAADDSHAKCAAYVVENPIWARLAGFGGGGHGGFGIWLSDGGEFEGGEIGCGAWTLVGDVYVEFYKRQGLDISTNSHQGASGGELKMSSEVVEELMRLKNILVKENENCNTCSLVNCSSQSNRVSSGDSASSSSADDHSLTHGSRRQVWKTMELLPLKTRSGGIFKYLRGPITDDMDIILSSSLSCYEQARKALGDMHEDSEDLQAVIKKVGWVCNELGRYRLEKKHLAEAEIAFAYAIKAFREVSDITNVVLIN